MSDPNITIRVGSTSDTRGLEQSEAALKHNEEAARDFLNTLKLGVGIDLGGKIVESIRDIPNVLREATTRGLEFNSMMQSSGIAIASGLRSVDPSLTFEEAKQKGSEALEMLRQKSMALGLDFQNVVETFKVNVPTMWQAGIHDTQKMIDLMLLLNSVAEQKGISGYQAQRDIIDLLNGQAERTILGKELQANGVTQEALKQAQENGTIFELIPSKLAAYIQGMQAAAGTWSGVVNTFHTELDSLLADASKPLFDDLTESLKELSAELASPEGKQGLRELGLDIKDLVHDGLALTQWAVKYADVVVTLGEGVVGLGLAMAALKIKDMVQGFISLSTKVSANTALWSEQTAVVRAHTTAVAADTAANVANAESGAAAGAAGAGAAAGAGGYVVRNAATGVAEPIVAAGGASAIAGGEAAALSVGSAAATGGAVAATSAFGGLGAALSGMVTVIAEAVPLVVAIGAAYETFTHLPASIGYGKLTTKHDLELAEGVTKDSKLPEFSKQGQQLSSVGDQNKLLSAMDDYTDELIARRAGLGVDESAQKDSITQEIALSQALEKKIQNISFDSMRSNEAAQKEKEASETAKKAADEKAATEAKYAEENAKKKDARDAAVALRKDNLADEHAEQMAREAAKRGESSSYIQDRMAALRAQADANPRITDPKADPKKVDAAAKINDDIESQLDRLDRAQKQVDEELHRAKIEDLKQQDALIEAQGKERIAEIEASGKKEFEIAEARKKVEDDVARQRLDLQNRIGQLEQESDTAKQIRLADYQADQLTRNRTSAKQSGPQATYENSTVERDLGGNITKFIPIPKKGESMDTDVTQRPGYHEQPSVDRLAAYAARQAPGAMRHPWETLPLPGPASRPGSSVAGVGQQNGGDPAALSHSIESGAARQLQAIQKAAASVDKAADTISRAIEIITKKVDSAAARIDRMRHS